MHEDWIDARARVREREAAPGARHRRRRGLPPAHDHAQRDKSLAAVPQQRSGEPGRCGRPAARRGPAAGRRLRRAHRPRRAPRGDPPGVDPRLRARGGRALRHRVDGAASPPASSGRGDTARRGRLALAVAAVLNLIVAGWLGWFMLTAREGTAVHRAAAPAARPTTRNPLNDPARPGNFRSRKAHRRTAPSRRGLRQADRPQRHARAHLALGARRRGGDRLPRRGRHPAAAFESAAARAPR